MTAQAWGNEVGDKVAETHPVLDTAAAQKPQKSADGTGEALKVATQPLG